MLLKKKNKIASVAGASNSYVNEPAASNSPSKPSSKSKDDHTNPDLKRLMEILRGKKKVEMKRVWPRFTVMPQQITPLPPDAKEAVYPLIRPYAYASIKLDPATGTLLYKVVEPELDAKEKDVFEKLKHGLVQVLDVSMASIKNGEALMSLLESKIQRLLDEYGIEISHESYLKIMYYVYRDFAGMDEIEPLLRDPYIEDLSCDGRGIPVYVAHRRFGNLKTGVVFSETKHLQEFIVKLAERCNRYVSYAEPLLDGSLPDGTRVQATLAGDVTSRGPTFSIRKFPENPFSPIDQIKLKTADADILAYLWYIVEHGANILIAGGTSTGKTSFLNSISFFMPPEDKVVSIEDTRELQLYHENWVPGVARAGFAGTKVGEVTMFALLREAFRQNPDYLLVGEVRGEEASVMFQAMASGITAMSTMHAGSAEDALKRLQTRPIDLPPSLMETLDVMILMTHVPEKGPSARRVRGIVEIVSVDPHTNRVDYKEAFSWDPAKDVYKKSKESYLLKQIAAEHGVSVSDINADIARRKEIIKWLGKKELGWKEVARYMAEYMRSPEKVIAAVRAKA
jgi:flagellar protein FlaI